MRPFGGPFPGTCSFYFLMRNWDSKWTGRKVRITESSYCAVKPPSIIRIAPVKKRA